MAHGYRLESLLELRERAKQAAEKELAGRLGVVEQATAGVAQAERELAAAQARLDEHRRRQAERELSGPSTPAGLAQARAYQRGLAAAVEACRAGVQQAQAALAAARQAADSARAALAKAEQARKAVALHKESWVAAAKREAERREEASQDDRVKPPPTPGRRSR